MSRSRRTRPPSYARTEADAPDIPTFSALLKRVKAADSLIYTDETKRRFYGLDTTSSVYHDRTHRGVAGAMVMWCLVDRSQRRIPEDGYPVEVDIPPVGAVMLLLPHAGGDRHTCVRVLEQLTRRRRDPATALLIVEYVY